MSSLEPIEIKPSDKIKVKVGDKEFELTKPKVGFLREFNRRMNALGKDGSTDNDVDLMCEFCLRIGVPADVIDNMDLAEMAQLLNAMNGAEKKS